ncbi:terminase large subunit domain-containing protein [Dichelobacter nodosus]
MYWRGYSCAEIARQLDAPDTTVRSWCARDGWDKASVAVKCATNVEYRYNQLIAKEDKSDKDFNEIELLAKQLERICRMLKYEKTANEADLNPKVKNRSKGREKKRQEKENLGVFTQEDIQLIKELFDKTMYPHQKFWFENRHWNLRQIIKSRQIGATYYFAVEALLTAIETGKNQIFLSASRNQANVFRSNIIAFVEIATGKTLRGENIKIGPGCTLYFLGTNSNTAQSYSGDLYIDEYFWIPKFDKIQHVASGMAVHDDRRITYFSTPSTIGHEAYLLWSGEHYNKERPQKEHINIDISHKNLAKGKLCDDGYWRQLITIDDAINSGFDRVTLPKLKEKFPNPSQFANLFMCEFVNDMNSLFKLVELQKCMIDARTIWEDWKPQNKRPLGNAPVWIGYDPSRTQDNASIAVIAPPETAGGKFRIIESDSYSGLDFEAQAKKIQQFTQRYNVKFIGIDATGIGKAVHDLVVKFYPRARAIIYNVTEKNNMVLKAYQLVHHKKLEFDAEKTEIASAFLTIHQAGTASGRDVTYRAKRTAKTGHADVAWAVMNALSNDPLGAIAEAGIGKGSGRVKVF